MYQPYVQRNTTTLGRLRRRVDAGNHAVIGLAPGTRCAACGGHIPYYSAADELIGQPHRHVPYVVDIADPDFKHADGLVSIERSKLPDDTEVIMHESTVPF